MKLKLPNWGSLCNPNLLMNSDYRSGIINQKGQTSYTKGSEDWGKMYSIDMWALQRGVQLNVNDGNISVKCTNSSEPGYLLQKLDYVGKATAAINIQSIIGEVSLETAYGEYELLKKGLNIITYDFGFEQSQGWFSMRISEGATVVIDYMKLEKGSYFTGMPVWNKSIELLKCQYDSVLVKAYNAFSARADGTYLSFLIPCQKMRKTPSIKNNKLFIIGNGESTSYTGEITCVNTENGIRCVIDYQKTASYTVCFEQDTILDSREY